MSKKAFEKIARGLREARLWALGEVETEIIRETNREDHHLVRRLRAKHEPR